MDDRQLSPDMDFAGIAIVGMACRFDGSHGLEDFWSSVVDPTDAGSAAGSTRGHRSHTILGGKPGDRVDRAAGLDNPETIDSCVRRVLANAVADVRSQLSTRDVGFVVGGIHSAVETAIFSNAVAAIGFQDARTVTYVVGSACLNLIEMAVHRLWKRDCRIAVIGNFQADSHKGVSEAGPGHMGVLVLKRLSDAESNGDKVYAVIRAIGVGAEGESRDEKQISFAGMQLALSRAYGLSGVSPRTIGLLEIEDTDSALPNGAEVEAWQDFSKTYGNRQVTRELKSLRAMAGDPGKTRGMASVIKATLALYRRVLPAMSICYQAALASADAVCYLSGAARPWIQSSRHGLRRAAVHSAASDGLSIHMILEEYGKEADHAGSALQYDRELIVLEAETLAGLQSSVRRLREYSPAGCALRDISFTCNSSLVGMPERISVVASSIDELGQTLDKAQEILGRDRKVSLRDRHDIHYLAEVDLRGAKVALLFPGWGSQYVNMFSDLCIHFPQARAAFDLAESATPGLKSLLFPPPLSSEEERTAAEASLAAADLGSVVPANSAMLRVLESVSLVPSMVAGHSIGELVALIASGVIEWEEFNATMHRLGTISRKLVDDPAIGQVALLMVGAPRAKVELFLGEENRRAYIVADNCPHQVVLLVDGQDEAAIRQDMLAKGLLAEKMPFRGVYHTPLASHIVGYFRDYLSSLKLRSPSIPMYSSATARLYPENPPGIVETMAQSFASPVLFRETIEAMYEAGARIFVECGPRSNLSAFVRDTLSGRPHITIPMDQLNSPRLASFHNALGVLTAAHVPIDLRPLYRQRGARRLTFDRQTDRETLRAEVRGVLGGDNSNSLESHTRIEEHLEHSQDEALASDAHLVPSLAADKSQVPDREDLLHEHFHRMKLFLTKHETMMKKAISTRRPLRSSGTITSKPSNRNHLQ